ncbi:RNA polymerase II C-terminal domain phosphatase-like 5 [Amaranthus tricolor]|uniref:RNA polymerase II C-terminal domain phosphatase-like 5 n=1 Tax=Amaranthus tricolor TaxID=29722 RepID=UPI002584DE84|nr:RNA polymerase II C-terminal domain phosphatase-like 5 [Amaranthus tricolor]
MVTNGIDVNLKASDTMLKMEHSSICRKIKQQKEKRRRMPLLLKRKDEEEKILVDIGLNGDLVEGLLHPLLEGCHDCFWEANERVSPSAYESRGGLTDNRLLLPDSLVFTNESEEDEILGGDPKPDPRSEHSLYFVPLLFNQTKGNQNLCHKIAVTRKSEIIYIMNQATSIRHHFDEKLMNDVRDQKLKKLLGQKKLHLVLDLDKTLLHSKQIKTLTTRDKLRIEVYRQMNKNGDLYEVGMKSQGEKFMTKLRPNVQNFLNEASKLFDFSVFTLGTRAYARRMMKLLDPDGLYFAHSQVITREDLVTPQSKKIPFQKDLNFILSHEKVVLIVDDDKKVWKNNAENLIDISPYEYFQDNTTQSVSSNRERVRLVVSEESVKYGELTRVLRELRKIHKEFYDIKEDNQDQFENRDVRVVIKEIKRKFRLLGN